MAEWSKNEDLVEHIKSERKFLHDISNQLLIAHGMGNFVLKQLKENPTTEDTAVQRMEKSMKAMNNLVDQIKARREVLHSIYGG